MRADEKIVRVIWRMHQNCRVANHWVESLGFFILSLEILCSGVQLKKTNSQFQFIHHHIKSINWQILHH